MHYLDLHESLSLKEKLAKHLFKFPPYIKVESNIEEIYTFFLNELKGEAKKKYPTQPSNFHAYSHYINNDKKYILKSLKIGLSKYLKCENNDKAISEKLKSIDTSGTKEIKIDYNGDISFSDVN